MIALLLALLACAHVPTHERSALLSRPMSDPATSCEAALDAHVWSSSESMTGAVAGGGVACGCN